MSETEEKFIRTEIKEIVIYVFLGILLLVILPFIGGFVLRGFESEILTLKRGGSFELASYFAVLSIYLFMMFGALAVIIYPIGRMVALKRNQHPATQDKPSWFTILTVSLLHSPEENGALYRLFEWAGLKGRRNPMRWSLSIFRVMIISILIFGTLGILTIVYPQLSIAGVPSTAQQISIQSDIIFGSAIPSFAENGVLMFIFFLALGFDAYLCSRFKLGLAGFFLIGFIFIAPLSGIQWMLMHSIIYSDSTTSLMATFIFGWVGATITLLTASFVFWLAWHFFNNGFIKIAEYSSSNEDIIFFSVIILAIIFILWIFGELTLRRFRKNKPEIPPSPQ